MFKTCKVLNNQVEKVFFCIFLFTLLVIYLVYSRLFQSNSVEWPLRGSAGIEIERRPPPLILSWNSYFEYKTAMEWLLMQNDVTKCACQCAYSGDRSLEPNASVLLFHIRTGFGPLPAHRRPDQLYAFFLLESPANSGGNHRKVPRDFFNISMSYRADSDIFYPYDAFEEFGLEKDSVEGGWTEEEVAQKVANKSKLAIQFISNCHTNSHRENYVKELMKHMNLTQMGQCVGRHGCNGECFDKMLDEHHFFLAFENSVCQNYVSEKFWNIKRLIVPVVLSRKVFANLTVPEGAFIAADDFGSPNELAEHLQRVAGDRALYMEHFQWTHRFKKTELRRGPKNALCQLCKMAHEKPIRQRHIENIVDFWESNGKCQDGFADILLKKQGKVQK